VDSPESSPAYLAHCVESFLKAMREAEALTNAGQVGRELSDVLHFAADLLEIIAEGLDGQHGASEPVADIEMLRAMLRSARGLLRGSATLH
jgi:hypothetical protein